MDDARLFFSVAKIFQASEEENQIYNGKRSGHAKKEINKSLSKDLQAGSRLHLRIWILLQFVSVIANRENRGEQEIAKPYA